MANKKNNLPRAVENQPVSGSSIVYANEVVATIAGVAASEIEGIADMCNISSGILSRNKNATKGVRVEVGPEEVSCDLYVIIEYGKPMQRVAQDVQENVRKSLEAMTGLRVVRVDVHVQGVSFEKETSALTAGAQKARLTAEAPAQKTEHVENPEVPAQSEETAAQEPVAQEEQFEPLPVNNEETPDSEEVEAEQEQPFDEELEETADELAAEETAADDAEAIEEDSVAPDAPETAGE